MNADSAYGHAEQGVTVTPSQLFRLLCNPTVPTCPPPLPASPVPPVPSSPPPLPRVPLPSPTGPVRHEAPSNTGGTTIPSIPMPAAAARLLKPSGQVDGLAESPLPIFKAPATNRVWLVAAHGGAGCTTILRSSPASYANAGRTLPVSRDPAQPSRIVLCAMCTGRGLESARALLDAWRRGSFGQTQLLGLAVTMPARRTPRELRRACLLVGSAEPALWRLPWIGGLDLDGFPDRYPSAYHRMLKNLTGGSVEPASPDPPTGQAG